MRFESDLVRMTSRAKLMVSAVLLALLVPMYHVIAFSTQHWVHHTPELALDRAMTLQPVWMLVYGSIWVFMLLPFLVVREDGLILRMVAAYITVVSIAYVGFLLYPTVGPRPTEVVEDGFFAWALRLNYAFDPPYNCFPSLHVAWAFVTMLTTYRVNRGVGLAAGIWACLIGVSTIYTKQHYVVDVIAGTLVAYIAYLALLRPHPAEAIPAIDRQMAPKRAMATVYVFAVVVAVAWLAYRI